MKFQMFTNWCCTSKSGLCYRCCAWSLFVWELSSHRIMRVTDRECTCICAHFTCALSPLWRADGKLRQIYFPPDHLEFGDHYLTMYCVWQVGMRDVRIIYSFLKYNLEGRRPVFNGLKPATSYLGPTFHVSTFLFSVSGLLILFSPECPLVQLILIFEEVLGRY